MLHKKQNEQDARVMDIVFEVMALFFIIANNFSTNILNCDMQRVLTRNVLMSHIITLGILYNLVLKVYKPKMSDVELLFKVVTVYTAFYVLNLQHPNYIFFDVFLFTIVSVIRRFVPATRKLAFDNASTIVLTGIILVGATLTYHQRPKGQSTRQFFVRTYDCPPIPPVKRPATLAGTV